jgi:hypothetical protein
MLMFAVSLRVHSKYSLGVSCQFAGHAMGDSYNDIATLRQADLGILYRPPTNVIDDHNDLTVVNSYSELKYLISSKIDLV